MRLQNLRLENIKRLSCVVMFTTTTTASWIRWPSSSIDIPDRVDWTSAQTPEALPRSVFPTCQPATKLQYPDGGDIRARNPPAIPQIFGNQPETRISAVRISGFSLRRPDHWRRHSFVGLKEYTCILGEALLGTYFKLKLRLVHIYEAKFSKFLRWISADIRWIAAPPPLKSPLFIRVFRT